MLNFFLNIHSKCWYFLCIYIRNVDVLLHSHTKCRLRKFRSIKIYFRKLFWEPIMTVSKSKLTFFHLKFLESSAVVDWWRKKNEKNEIDEQINVISDWYLDVVKRIPLTPPKVDSETNTGMIHHITPYRRWENTWSKIKLHVCYPQWR